MNDYESAYLKSYNANPALWKDSGLASRNLDNSLLLASPGELSAYHLVMTNLSPWITTQSWSTLEGADGPNVTADLLAAPPCRPWAGLRHPFEHIHELREALDKVERPVVWIGHGKHSVWHHFRTLMLQMGNVEWLLAGNLGYPMNSRFVEIPERFAEDTRARARVSKSGLLDEEE